VTSAPDEQLALVKATLRRSRTKAPEAVAAALPVAQVVVDLPLPHLDRTFDYAVPESMAEGAQPGTRVRVRFAGRQVDGWLVARVAESNTDRELARLQRLVSPDRVLTPDILELSRAVAERYAGVLTDVLRSAVPPRHAATETAMGAVTAKARPQVQDRGVGPWARYVGGEQLLLRLQSASSPVPRAAWTALPGEDWAAALAHLAAITVSSGKSAVLVLPDARDVRRMEAALIAALGRGNHVVLSADRSPAARYRAFLMAERGFAPVAIGTRAAVFAPTPDLGLLALWDDGDDSFADPRAPYWHTREVMALRSQLGDVPMVVGSYARSVDVARSVRTGWLTDLAAPRDTIRKVAPRVRAVGGDGASETELARDPAARSARLPHEAWEIARSALQRGPVLVQVPRSGYVPNLSCQHCREQARCQQCSGPLQLTGPGEPPRCARCGRFATDWHCQLCGGSQLRAGSRGARRTADELGRAFSGVPIITSGRDPGGAGVVDDVPDRPALVVATPGAEPVAAGGYAAALLLDGRLLLDRPELRAGEEAVRRWLAAVALVRPASEGGTVVLVADATLRAVQALVRYDPAGFAERELVERTALRLPPAARVAELIGALADVQSLLAATRLPPSAQVLGPISTNPTKEGTEQVRAVITVPTPDGAALAHELHLGAGVRSARKAGGPVTTRIDPITFA
jgi:primosomal protein N' (replication factor Y)